MDPCKRFVNKKVNKDLNVFTDDLKFSHDQFDKLIIKNKLQDHWTKMKSGHFTTNKPVIKDNLHVEDIKNLISFEHSRT